jgi:hypothetical protein
VFPANTWCYDLEIIRAILDKGKQKEPGIQYCGGWTDHAGMGISVLVVARPDGSDVRTFIGDTGSPLWTKENHIGLFAELAASADLMVGHNSRSFDAKVLAALGIYIPTAKHLDFYHEVKTATKTPFPRGYNLNLLSQRCGGPAKTDDGAMAPHLWQVGDQQRVVDYCKNDILMTCAIADYYAKNSARVPSPEKDFHVQLRTPAELN